MLRNADSLYRLELHARDGVIGRVKDFFFDDHYWTNRASNQTEALQTE